MLYAVNVTLQGVRVWRTDSSSIAAQLSQMLYQLEVHSATSGNILTARTPTRTNTPTGSQKVSAHRRSERVWVVLDPFCKSSILTIRDAVTTQAELAVKTHYSSNFICVVHLPLANSIPTC